MAETELGLIEHWQETSENEQNVIENGVIARLSHGCLDLFSQLLRRVQEDTLGFKKTEGSLRRSYGTLKLWADGHGALDGRLDRVLERSKTLKRTTLVTLHSICGVLLNRLGKMVISMSSETQSTFLHKSNAYVLYEQTKWILAEDDEDGFDSDSDSEASSDDIEKCMIEEIVEDIKVYIQCLVDLGSALECPAFDPDFDEDETDMTRVKTHTAYDYYSDLIMDKYPNVNRDLADCLGKANWERYQRLQSERMRNEQTSVASTEQREVVVSKSCFSSSEFHDSGLGTSLSAQDVTYPETVISYISSVSNSRRISIPPLSLEARDGRQFECLACSKYIRATTNRAWRKHLFHDLRPYICFYPSCHFNSTPFVDRLVWTDHLDLDHKMGPDWLDERCPLCHESTGTGKSNIIMHYARHLEEISVAALPRGIASEANSDAESNDSLDPEITFPSTAGDPSISNRASAPTTIDPTMVQTIQLRKSQGQSNCHESQLSHLIDGQLPMLFSVTSEDTIESLTWAVKGCLSISDNLDIDLVLEDEEQNPISLDFETITSTTVFYVLLVPKPEHRNIKPAGSLRLGNGTSILNSGLGTSYQVVKDLNERHPEVHSSESGWKFQGNDKPPDRSNFGEFGQSFALGTPASTSQQDIPASIGSHPTSKPHAMCEAQTDENLICCTFVDCNLTFRRPGDYRRHMRTHMGRPYLSAS